MCRTCRNATYFVSKNTATLKNNHYLISTGTGTIVSTGTGTLTGTISLSTNNLSIFSGAMYLLLDVCNNGVMCQVLWLGHKSTLLMTEA